MRIVFAGLSKNPLRILDSKNPDMQDVVAGAPVMLDYLDDESAEHFARAAGTPGCGRGGIRDQSAAGSRARLLLPHRVRVGHRCTGLTRCGLCGWPLRRPVEKLGGRPTPAVGWAMGIERFVALFEACGGKITGGQPDVYIAAVGEGTLERAFALAEELRADLQRYSRRDESRRRQFQVADEARRQECARRMR